MNESTLATQCSKGDNQARRMLYECYARHMFALCYRYAGDEQTAEDLLHDGFIRVFETIQNFEYRGEGSLKAWIGRLFANVALGHLRKQANWETCSLEELEEEITEAEIDIVPSEVLMQFIAELPVGYRAVFNQYVMEGQSHKEVADAMGIAESASRSQLTRAKTMLAKKIKDWNENNS